MPWCLLWLMCGGSAVAWSPGTGTPTAASGFSVNAQSRSDVLSFYNCVYSQSESYASHVNWTGNVATGVPGTTSAVFKEDVRRRVNFYRALAGVEADVAFDNALSAKDQDAALIFAANLALSHLVTDAWIYYTANGAEAAASSNVSLQWGDLNATVKSYGPPAVDAYMIDNGATTDPTENRAVGHRRWLLYGPQQTMGTGDIPSTTVTRSGTTFEVSTNALWIKGPYKSSYDAKAVPWPSAGYFPFPLMPARWSFTYPGADFSGAAVTMTLGGTALTGTIVSKTDTGRGDNTIVWEPNGLPPAITSDTVCTVTVSGYTVSGTSKSNTYTVRLFNPGVLGDSVSISGTAAPFVTGGNYTFNPIGAADAYQLRVTTLSGWTEGAEDATSSEIQEALQIVDPLSPYVLRQTALKRTGSKAFQMAFPDAYCLDQGFVVTRAVIPTASSALQFDQLRRFASLKTVLSAEVSADGGSTWTGVWSRAGVDDNQGTSWDAGFGRVSVSLSGYAGKTILVRFVLRFTGDLEDTVFFWESGDVFAHYGFFIDDVTVTDSAAASAAVLTTLSGTAASFTLNAATAGAALASGTGYYMQIRPQVGLRWYDYGAVKQVTPRPLMTYSDWVSQNHPSFTGGPAADDNRNGVSNGAEFAFGLDSNAVHSPSALPRATIAGGTLSAAFTQPDGVTGVTYGAQWSADLVNWFPITDTGVSPAHAFSVSTGTASRAFFRLRLSFP